MSKTFTVSDAEHNTLLAALYFWQASGRKSNVLREIIEESHEVTLSSKEIGDLFYRILVGHMVSINIQIENGDVKAVSSPDHPITATIYDFDQPSPTQTRLSYVVMEDGTVKQAIVRRVSSIPTPELDYDNYPISPDPQIDTKGAGINQRPLIDLAGRSQARPSISS